ncbi:MAG: hypothetical protein CFE27_08690 [Alphaproteobacteria bacterium PA1]|nr:MAG: hypothetical protein CFE27_08690 [Alphaproteobacteria bacterium PA1]
MNNWIQTTVGEQATLQRGFDITRAAQRPGPVPVISSGGTSSFHDEAAAKGPGVVLGRKGVVGSVFFVETDYWPHDTTLWVRDFHGNDPRFVYYFFRSFASELARLDVGSANPTLNRNHVHPVSIVWPSSVVEQQAISALLGSLDDKIELNRRMNETLETMAQAIFRDWFVDFGPVRRKMEGAIDPVVIMGGVVPDPARVAELTGLFPGTFTGDLPDRWSSSTLGDHFRLERGLSYKGAFLHEDGLPMINLGCFLGGGSFSYGRMKGYKGEHKMRHLLKSGTLILANTDMTQNRIILGSPHIVQEGLCGEEVLFSHHVYAARPRFESSSAWARFFYFHLLQPEFRARAEGFATGTTVLALPKDAVEGLEFPVPSEELNAAFLSLVEPLLDRVTANELENRTLAETRDYLLPRLMSGEVSVRDVYSAVSE